MTSMPLPLSENEFGVSIVLIAHNNRERFITRLEREVLPTIAAHPHWKFQLIIIDNSDVDNRELYNFKDEDRLQHLVIWPGSNLMYGPSMNLAVKVAIHPYLIYICSNHGRMYNPTWIDDLVNPMVQDSKIAMTGSSYPSGNPVEMGFPANLPPMHIQGGVFGARTETLIAHPYTTDERWIHWGSDIYLCYQLLLAGYVLHPVKTVNSVWRQCVSSPEQWKYVHDYAEE